MECCEPASTEHESRLPAPALQAATFIAIWNGSFTSTPAVCCAQTAGIPDGAADHPTDIVGVIYDLDSRQKELRVARADIAE